MHKALIPFALTSLLATACVVREGPASPHSHSPAPPPPPPAAAAAPTATDPAQPEPAPATTPPTRAPSSPTVGPSSAPRPSQPQAKPSAAPRPSPSAAPARPGSSSAVIPPSGTAPEGEKKKGTYTEVYDANGNPIPPASREGPEKQPEEVDPKSPKKLKKLPPPR